MKIAHIISSCSPGGAEIFVKNLLIEMKKRNIDVELWVMHKCFQINPIDKIGIEFENNFISNLQDNGIPVNFIGKRPNKDWLLTNKKLNRLYIEKKPQVIHTHLEAVSFHVAKALCFKKTKLIQTIHNTKIYYKKIMRLLSWNVFDKFVAISEKVRQVAVNLGIKPYKIVTILNGIDLEVFKNRNRTISDDVKSIVSIGRLTQAKNHKNLIQAISILKTKYIDELSYFPKTKILGDGELKSELQAFVLKKKLSQYIDLIGIKNNIHEILNNSDLYVMSSDWEGLSISLIEALASGIPIIATNAGSNNEIVDNQKSGFIVPVNNPDALADAIFMLIKNRSLRVFFSQEATKSAENFSIKECANRHLILYRQLSG